MRGTLPPELPPGALLFFLEELRAEFAAGAHDRAFEPSAGQMIAAVAFGAVMSYGAVSLPGEITFISSIAPIAMALGVPIAPLALLVAVEMIPDIFRTVGNVTMDVAVTTAVDHGVDPEPSPN